jgi:lambda family phage minor tail protein L
MPLSLSAAAYLEKNNLASSNVWIVLVEITLPDATVLRVCSNNANVTWPSSGGDEYVKFPFDIEDDSESSDGQVPELVLKVSNVSRVMQSYMDQADGGVGSTVRVMVVNSGNLAEADPELEMFYEVVDAKSDSMWAYFTLGADNPFRKRFPKRRAFKNHCRYRNFKGDQCGYGGAETECDRTLTRCRALGNSERFGGFPGVGQKGLYVTV